mmetsp:Transcript_32612/g.106013  ORF Transcript_32612/g.106013 Transcript_32612/m.106013 type:complete len:260 (+) Transcript_32612:379-1158(+)
MTRLMSAKSARNWTSRTRGWLSIASSTRSRPRSFSSSSFCWWFRARFTRLQQPMACTESTEPCARIDASTAAMPPRFPRNASRPWLAMPRWKTMPSAPPMGRARKTTQWSATTWSSAAGRNAQSAATTCAVTRASSAALRARSQWSRSASVSRHRRWTPATSSCARMMRLTSSTDAPRARELASSTDRCSRRSSGTDRPSSVGRATCQGASAQSWIQTSRFSRTRSRCCRQIGGEAAACRSGASRKPSTTMTMSGVSSM